MNESSSPLGFVAPEPSDLAPLFPAYEIHDLIATGGMGAVYRAVQKSLDRTVAIKILPMEFSEDAEFCAGFEAEAKAMARLNHPNLIAVYDFGEVNGMLFIVMEFVPGKSIYHSAYGKAIDPLEVIRLVTGVCNGLAHAHENGILHRDIKPSNILLTSQAEPKIGDFGLARPVERKTQAGEEIFGTPGYTAPEVVDTPALVDHRADLFSVGILLHELLTGKLPDDDTRPTSVIAGCDARFDAIIRRATDPIPANRYSSAAQIASELQKITASRKAGPIAQEAPSQFAGASRPGPPRRTAVVAKSKSTNLKWVGPLIAISIIAFSWNQFMNVKPKVVEVKAPVIATVESPGPKSASEMVNESIAPQPEISPTPPPIDSNVQDVAKAEPDGKLISEELKAAFQGKTDINDSNIEPPDRSETSNALSGIPSDAKSFNGKKYHVFKDPCKWEIALKRCEELGGRLATIPDAATQKFIEDLAGQRTFWLGATDEKSEGKWRWIDGSEMKFQNFGTDQPDNWKGEEHWLAINWKSENGEWNDVPADHLHGYICEWGKSLSTASSAQDLAGKDPLDVNTWKAMALQQFPSLKEPSSELARKVKALKEKKETLSPSYFKNPQWPHLLANEASLELEKEAQAAKDRHASRFPAGAVSFRGKKYLVYDDNISWNRARVRCTDADGQLAVVPDEATQDFLTELAQGRSLWLGASDQKKEGTWIWVDGTKMEYRAFATSQPNNAGDGQDFLYFRSGGFWYDADDKDDIIQGYICEWLDTPPPGTGK